MTPKEQSYYNEELNKDRDELIMTVVALRMKLDELSDYGVSNTAALTYMHTEFKKCRDELNVLKAENEKLKKALSEVIEKEILRTKDIYGRSSEKLKGILDPDNYEEIVDEAETEVQETGEKPFEAVNPPVKSQEKVSPHGQRSRKAPSQKVDLNALPQQSCFKLDVDALNEKYGRGNWRIAFWKDKRTVEIPRRTAYCLNTYTPVLSVGLEHDMVSAYNPGMLPGSFISPSFLAYVEYERFFMSMPFYRQAESFKNMGLNISRQTLTNWHIRFAMTHFSLVYDRLHEELMKVPYHQCDETFTQVINDGRNPGSTSYFWVHRTSELYPCRQIILYSFELTRSTEHLRKFYDDFKGFITCDAYCAYRILEAEKAEAVIVCGCMMHLRRRFAESAALINTKALTAEQQNALPEVQALKLIGKIYAEDEKLKGLTPEERQQARDTTVRPLVNAFFEFIEALPEDPAMSSHLKDAIQYAKNQKGHLIRFLEDGYIPIDDGATERAIRTFAISKKNSLFFDSTDGAEAAGIMYSISETAKACGVNVYLYFLYLLEEISKHLDDTDRSFLDAMLPWSEEYKEYEKRNTENISDLCITGEPGKKPGLPKTPGKKDPPRETEPDDHVA